MMVEQGEQRGLGLPPVGRIQPVLGGEGGQGGGIEEHAVPEPRQERAGGAPSSMCPQIGQRWKAVSARSCPFFTAARARA
jgi:hypothetical protein